MVTIIRNTKVNLAKTKNTNIPYFFLNKITRNSKILLKEFLNILIMNSMTEASFLSMVLIDMVLCSRKCSKKVFLGSHSCNTKKNYMVFLICSQACQQIEKGTFCY